MRRDVAAIVLIAALALAVRVFPARSLSSETIDFLETDAWYHLRLVEHQVRNFPWRATLDPFAAPGGQFVPIPPLYDTLTAAAVVVLHGRDATALECAQVAAWLPPGFGVLTVLVLWRLGRRLFGPAVGLLAAALAALLPGHFLDRTMFGFVDHHALEALLLVAWLWTLARAADPGGSALHGRRFAIPIATAGVLASAYLLTWSGGALVLAVTAVWMLTAALLTRDAAALHRVATVVAAAVPIALAAIALFQDSRMHRYDTQVAGLVCLGVIAVLVRVTALFDARRRALAIGVSVAVAVVAIVGALAAWWPNLATAVATDVGRLAPDSSRRAVLEARPLFMYAGAFDWWQPWSFFRGGFYAGALGLVAMLPRLWRHRRAGDLLVWLFALAMLAATIGQNRFGYYLVPLFALLGAWLIVRLLERAGALPGPRAANEPLRLAAAVAAAALLLATCAPDAVLRERRGVLPSFWAETMDWLAAQTPAPFSGEGSDYYYARYQTAAAPGPDYTVMTWWDQGYWVTQRARRVPVANPTQARAGDAARFYADTDEPSALARVRAESARYVVADWELPFRLERGTVMGRFQSVLDWAGHTHADYYDIVYRRDGAEYVPVWIFRPAYYRSMAFRLMVLGGAAAEPNHATTVLALEPRDDGAGGSFTVIVAEQTYPTYIAALEAAAASTATRTEIAGLDPWRAAFPVPALQSFQQVFAARPPSQRANEAPWTRIFRVVE